MLRISKPIFKPKTTGQRRGIGLSLNYDTIKAHRGELRVKMKEGEDAEFIVKLANSV